ncbi:hypothetical protein VPH35_077548 [Triticum aestivum]|uniref:Pumilio-like protein n=1 Tax=Aegilops tauschii TaxID=37682 RepID=M8BBF5_AEGTA
MEYEEKCWSSTRIRKIMHVFVTEILDCVNELSIDPYGNYVVQSIVEHGGPHHRQTIVLKFAGRIVHMSHQKHSSNVIEKCLKYGVYHDRNVVITEILSSAVGMITHQYVNYVVQKMIEVAVERQFNVIMDVVICNKGMLVNYTHGRHVIAHVERLNARPGFPNSLPPTPSQSV